MGLVAMSRQSQKLTVDQTDVALLCTDETHRIGNYRVQHRLNIGRRAGNHAQDFTRCRLLLQRFLEFLEQPDVLQRDHCLIGKGFEQLDLCWSERIHLGTTPHQCANEFAALKQRHG